MLHESVALALRPAHCFDGVGENVVVELHLPVRWKPRHRVREDFSGRFPARLPSSPLDGLRCERTSLVVPASLADDASQIARAPSVRAGDGTRRLQS